MWICAISRNNGIVGQSVSRPTNGEATRTGEDTSWKRWRGRGTGWCLYLGFGVAVVWLDRAGQFVWRRGSFLSARRCHTCGVRWRRLAGGAPKALPVQSMRKVVNLERKVGKCGEYVLAGGFEIPWIPGFLLVPHPAPTIL